MAGIGLHQNLSLGQTLSPQMQQSLQFLQAPAMELQSLVQQEIEINPVLVHPAGHGVTIVDALVVPRSR